MLRYSHNSCSSSFLRIENTSSSIDLRDTPSFNRDIPLFNDYSSSPSESVSLIFPVSIINFLNEAENDVATTGGCRKFKNPVFKDKLADFLATLLSSSKGKRRIHCLSLRHRYGTRGWPKILNKLIDAGIITRSEHYIIGSKCYEYRLKKRYLEETETDTISIKWRPDPVRSKRLENNSIVEKVDARSVSAPISPNLTLVNGKELPLSPAQQKVKELIMKLEVDSSFENDNTLTAQAKIQLQFFRDRPRFCVTCRHGRLHHSFTCLKTEARKYILMDGKRLVGVDYSCLHPFLLTSYLPEDSKEKAELKNILADDFYAELGRRTGIEKRDQIKTEFNVGLNSKVSECYNLPSYRGFARSFPETAKVVEGLKVNGHAGAACALQRTESNLVFNGALTELQRIGISCISLHDAIFTTEENVEIVVKHMVEAGLRMTGLNLKVKVDRR